MKEIIVNGRTSLGIEFGSTRVKAVLLDIDSNNIIATGIYNWENKMESGYWTYDQDEIIKALQECYKDLKQNVYNEYEITITKINYIGISAMMHGYIVLDKNNQLLTPFRTWRNTQQEEASNELSDLLNFPIPQRWSVAHLYQAVLNEQEHIKDICFTTTLAGYVHFLLTDNKVIGVGDASGMFPIDDNCSFDKSKIAIFNDLLAQKNINLKYEDILPKVLKAGEEAGTLSSIGSKILDVDQDLESGAIFCPPEGDAGTGMVATNSVDNYSGNISVGTSVFAMIVLDNNLSKVYKELDLVTTPEGKPVAMVHCNNCTSNFNRWINLFEDFASLFNMNISREELFEQCLKNSLNGDSDAGGLLSYEYLSGEHITNLDKGLPMLLIKEDSNFNMANLVKCIMYSSLSTLKIGMDILIDEENIKIDNIVGHGGLFKTELVGQEIVSQATKSPITIMDNAEEGGAWGIALLAKYLNYSDMTLIDYLNDIIFNNVKSSTIMASDDEIHAFDNYVEHFKDGLEVEKKAIEKLLK